MTRRRPHKRWRKNAKFHKAQESLRKNVRSRRFNSKNGDKERNLSRPRSPESVLFESHADSLCDDKLSPEIIPRQPRTRSESLKDDPETAAHMIQQSSPVSRKNRELDLPMCDFKLDECVNDFPNLEDSGEREEDVTKSIVDDPFDLVESYSFSLSSLNTCEPNSNVNGTANVTHDGRFSSKTVDEMARRDTSELSIPRPNLESQSRDGACIFANVPGPANSDEKGSLEVRSKDHYVLETVDDRYLLDKTQSMNDNLACEINNYLGDRQSSTDANKLETELVYRSVDGPRDNPDEKRETSCGSKTFDVALEKIGERLTANWREFRKIFTYLRRANIFRSERARGEDVADSGESLLYRYRKVPYVSVSTLSLPTSVLRTPSLSLRRVSHKAREFEETKREAEKTGIPSESTTPRTGLMKRCRRTTLTFEEEEVARHCQPASRADITDPLPEGKKEGKGRSFQPNLPSFFNETRQNGRIPESTIASNVELSDRDGGSSQKIEYHWDDTSKPQTPQNISTSRDSRSHVPRRRNIYFTVITWMIVICIWLIKKSLHLVNISYEKLKLTVSPSSSWTKKFDCLMETMRSESEMMHVTSEKMTRLSEDFVQIRTTTEATLNTLTAEMNVFREASKKMTEDNMTLLQELKKLRETLGEVRIKSSQSVTLPSSCCSPRPPPPPPPLPLLLLPPPPPPPPLLPLSFPPKVHASESASSIPPPPPLLLPSVSLQSPIPSIQPTTPNSSRSNKIRTPTRKCSTPLFSRPSITVEDLLKVTLKKAPQSIKENRRNTVPGPKGPLVSLEMLRNVKLKSAKRRPNDQTGRSPRNGRVTKSRIMSNINLSPILTGSEGNLERILRQVDLNRPRRLLASSSSFRERDFAETQYQSLKTLTCSQSTLE